MIDGYSVNIEVQNYMRACFSPERLAVAVVLVRSRGVVTFGLEVEMGPYQVPSLETEL